MQEAPSAASFAAGCTVRKYIRSHAYGRRINIYSSAQKIGKRSLATQQRQGRTGRTVHSSLSPGLKVTCNWAKVRTNKLSQVSMKSPEDDAYAIQIRDRDNLRNWQRTKQIGICGLVLLIFTSFVVLSIGGALYSRVFFVPIPGGCNITSTNFRTVQNVGECRKTKNNFVLRYYADFEIDGVIFKNKRLCHGHKECYESAEREDCSESADCFRGHCNLEVITSNNDLAKFSAVKIGSMKDCYYDPTDHNRAGYGFRQHKLAHWAAWTLSLIIPSAILWVVSLICCIYAVC